MFSICCYLKDVSILFFCLHIIGKSCTGNQRYRCRSCRRTHSKTYQYTGCVQSTNESVVCLLKEGCGIRSISRILGISAATVIRKIVRISKRVQKPAILFGKQYELEEMRTYVQRKTKLLWIVSALRKDTKQVIDFVSAYFCSPSQGRNT